MIAQQRNEPIYFEDQRSYHTLKTGWIYDEGHWYYLLKDGGFDSRTID